MKRIATILLISISTLSSAFCRAESVAITHDFNDMASKGELTFPNRPGSYAVGETDLVTYTGSDGGTFASVSGGIGITLPNNGVMQTSPEISDLTRLHLMHTKGSIPSNIKIYISTDNSSWTEISSSASVGPTDIDAPMPTKGNYFIKVVNKSGSPISFLMWRYTYEPCHCLRVVVN